MANYNFNYVADVNPGVGGFSDFYFDTITNYNQIIVTHYTNSGGYKEITKTSNFTITLGNSAFNWPSVLPTSWEVSATNDEGEVVGTAPNNEVFIIRNNDLSYLTLPGATTAAANQVNDRGDIIGFYDDAVGDSHGYLYSSGSWQILAGPQGYNAIGVTPEGINNSGEIVGQFTDSKTLKKYDFIFQGGSYSIPQPSPHFMRDRRLG